MATSRVADSRRENARRDVREQDEPHKRWESERPRLGLSGHSARIEEPVWPSDLVLLARTALSFAPGHLWRAKVGALHVLRALAGAAYDDGFITTLSSELSLQPATVQALRQNRATELAIVSSSRQELQEALKSFNITSICDVIAISSWSNEAKRARRKEEEEAERARRKQQKLDEAKIVFVFNENSRKYEKYQFQDQNSLQNFMSNDRIRGFAIVDDIDFSNEVLVDWAQLVNGSYYSAPEKKEDAVKVLIDKFAKDEKAKTEYGCSRMLSDYYRTEFVYIDSDIKLKDKRGNDLGDIDSLFISKNGSQVVLLERRAPCQRIASPISSNRFSPQGRPLSTPTQDSQYRFGGG